MDKKADTFINGFAAAIGIMVTGWGEVHLAEMIIKEANFTKCDFKDCEEFDKVIIDNLNINHSPKE